MRTCLACQSHLTKRAQKVYCSNKCQSNFQYHAYIADWKNKLVDGNKGIKTRNISQHLKRYFMEKYGERCSICGWKKHHPHSGNVPLEIDHMDGNSENNNESNLRLLCPNCHSLTPNFKNYNKGRGRGWRNKDK